MTQPLPSRRRRVPRALLIALAAAACDDGVTGPRAPAEGPPPDTRRVASVAVTDTQIGAVTLNRFIYDDDGRLIRQNFFISAARNGPPTQNTLYVEHQYARDVLTRTDYFQVTGSGEFANWKRVTYGYDRRGYLTRETAEIATPDRGVLEFTTVHRYDGAGRRIEDRERNGDRVVYRYAADGSLASTEMHSLSGPVLRFTHQHDAGRNPFFRRVAHFNSVVLPILLPSLLLSPTNLTRQETRVDDDPALVASLTNEYEYDEDGRPRHIRQRFVNDIHPGSRGTVLFIDIEYEPVP